MKKQYYQYDNYGTPIVPGALVAYNLSGIVAKGVVIEIDEAPFVHIQLHKPVLPLNVLYPKSGVSKVKTTNLMVL